MPKAATARKQQPTSQSTGLSTAEIQRIREHVDARLGGLSIDRYSWWSHWREIADYLIPRRYKWLITPNQATRGSPINQRIIDSTATIALRICAPGMLEGMTSPNQPWFKQTIDDKDLKDIPGVKLWLAEVTSRMSTVLAQSNFYTATHTLNSDLAAFGTGVMLMYEDFDDVVRFYNCCAGEYYLANSSRLEVDTLYRLFVRTTKQLVDEYGLENCSPTVQQAVSQGHGASLSREVLVAHGVEPNPTYMQGAPGQRGMKFREVYWEYGSTRDRLLRVRGFHESPIVAPRWDIVGNDAYGRGPGMDALGDIKQLQVEQKRKAQAIDKMVNPPLIADVRLKNEPASMIPGGVTYADLSTEKPGMKPVYEVSPQIDHLVEDIKEVQDRINQVFFRDLFMMLANMEGVQPRNQLEIMERKSEKIIQLGPMVERFENEGHQPVLDRLFYIMLRGNMFPPIPAQLKGKFIKTEYTSIFAQMQKASLTTSIEQFAGFVGRVMAGTPEAADNVDWDEMINEYADFMGISPKIVRPLAKVLKMRMQRAQQAQEQQQMEQTMAGVQGAQTLSQTDVGGGKNALQMMIGGGGGSQQ